MTRGWPPQHLPTRVRSLHGRVHRALFRAGRGWGPKEPAAPAEHNERARALPPPVLCPQKLVEIDTEMKGKVSAYNKLKGQLGTLERNQT